ncbi:DUF6002 family protein [Micromonospora sp. NPDC048170]|uniref:DUF6002 family protein n=1 Tax=Micromonospora sp. NPDC048170 TaxID=3154819 RepID=UPI0033EDB07C
MAHALTERLAPTVVRNTLSRYGRHVRQALEDLRLRDVGLGGQTFVPVSGLPDDERLDAFFAPSDVAFHALGEYRGKRLTLLDLMRNPRTRTTKTYPSLVIVARAVQHIWQTGERVMIVTPSSANKATALRDAVLWAIECDLVTPEQLQILSVVPLSSRPKLWSSPLSEDGDLARRNPLVTYGGGEPGDVKLLARQLVEGQTEQLWQRHGVRLWHTMDIENYKAADVVRAHAEREFLPVEPGAARLHVHAVSSAFGLLGHNLGIEQLARDGQVDPASAHYFLVQHLGTPDMVLGLRFGDASRDLLPAYQYDPVQGLYRQDADPHFPQRTYAVDEILDPTFYTRRPATSAQMHQLIRQRGGGGIVVSLHECLERYGELRALLGPAGTELPADPRQLREWSLAIAVTGMLNAIDRGLVAEDDILVHGSGSYDSTDYRPIPEGGLVPVDDVAALAAVAEHAVTVGPR